MRYIFSNNLEKMYNSGMANDFVGLDKLSVLDYEDRVSCVLFSKACNFRCPFCHNGLTVLESDDTIPWNEVMDYLKLRRGMLDAVVVSGGEPTLLPGLVDKLNDIKSLGYEIKLDTNGTNPELVESYIKSGLIDYVAMDIKNSEAKYPLTAGVKNVDMDAIKKSIKLLKEAGIAYEFRTTLVDEFHKLEDMKGIGELIKGAPILYLQKFVDREGCIQKGLHEVDEETAKKFKEVLLHYVNKVELRGY